MNRSTCGAARRFGASVAIAAAVAALSAGSAMAAGTGYGSAPPSSSLPPSGFTTVVTARTIGPRGGVVRGRVAGGLVRIVVPRGIGKGLQVALTKGRAATVRADLPGYLRRRRILSSFGVELRHGSSPAKSRKLITVYFVARSIRRGDLVVAYNAKTRKFVRTNIRVVKGRLIGKIRVSESVAVLAPKK